MYFYPRSPCGERLFFQHQFIIHHSLFLSTLSLRRATHQQGCHQDCQQFLSTLSLRRATRQTKQTCRAETSISIHALLAESDTIFLPSCAKIPVFLSTLSLRRATSPAPATMCSTTNFYPRSPCGERRFNPFKTFIVLAISIHALLAESDRESPR